MTDDRTDGSGDVDDDTLYERMEPLEPYTTGELAGLLDIPRQFARSLLESLFEDGSVRKKEPEPDSVIWVREPPKHECPDCGHRFEVKMLHPILSSVRFCPRCGNQL